MKKQIVLIASIILSNTAFASSAMPYVFTISGGPAWANAGETQTIALNPENVKSYVPANHSSQFAAGEIFAGLQKTLPHHLISQFGVALAAADSAVVEGVVWDDASQQFANYQYQYEIHTTRIAVKGKLLYDGGYSVMPWISVSLGAGFNRASGFTNTPQIFEAVPIGNFTSNTETSFAYTLGAGIEKSVNQRWAVGAGYEFADWGKSSLGRSAGQTMNSGLSANHVYTNGLMMNVTLV